MRYEEESKARASKRKADAIDRARKMDDEAFSREGKRKREPRGRQFYRNFLGVANKPNFLAAWVRKWTLEMCRRLVIFAMSILLRFRRKKNNTDQVDDFARPV